MYGIIGIIMRRRLVFMYNDTSGLIAQTEHCELQQRSARVTLRMSMSPQNHSRPSKSNSKNNSKK
jgi:hypothetical protein